MLGAAVQVINEDNHGNNQHKLGYGHTSLWLNTTLMTGTAIPSNHSQLKHIQTF